MTDDLQIKFIAFQQSLADYLAQDEISQVISAYNCAKKAHQGQQRRSGDSYISHPLAVAQILAELKLDYQCLMAALLHDVVEDTFVTYTNLVQDFGVNVADLVSGVTKLTNIDFQTKAEAQAENFQKMALAMVRDIRVILIKLADRLHNMRTLNVVPSVKAKRIAQETLDIYAPIAKRLGLYDIYLEFEDLGFGVIYPMRAKLIYDSVQKIRSKHENVINIIKQQLTTHLHQFGLTGEVIGREKHLYSIYRKMKQNKQSFAQIMNIYTLKVVVNSRDNCYRVLGKVHELYKPVPGNIRDHIAIPKVNGYQSLHTTIFGVHDVNIEVQIRTYEMNEFANKGITVLNHQLLQSGDFRVQNWINLISDLQKTSANSAEFLASVKSDLFSDAVYVFTPRGRIIELPRNSCAVDFAYMIHSDVGNSCVACRINREMASLSQFLYNGDMVEIITAPNASPKKKWIDFVATARAKSHINHALNKQKKLEAIILGEILINNELAKFNSYFEQVEIFAIAKTLEQYQINNTNNLLEKIGKKELSAQKVVQSLMNLHK